jgi:hypothetical protein
MVMRPVVDLLGVIFFGRWSAVFAGVFEKNGVQSVVF